MWKDLNQLNLIENTDLDYSYKDQQFCPSISKHLYSIFYGGFLTFNIYVVIIVK